MAGHFILSTRKGDYRALAFQGSQVYTCHAQLDGLLRTHLGEAYARLLAEPLMDPQGTAVDWYAALPVRPITDLPPEKQDAAQTRLRALLDDVEGLAATLQADTDPYKSLCGTMLHLATRFPTPECVYVSETPEGLQPVLVCWGMTPPGATGQGLYGAAVPLASGASADPGRIVREGDAARPVAAPLSPTPPVPPTVVVVGEPWWKKLLMLLLGLLLALLLFWGLHVLFPWIAFPLPSGCVKAPATPAVTVPEPAVPPDPAPSDTDLSALRAELETLRQAARKRAEACEPPTPPEPPVVEPPKEEPPKEPPQDLGDLLGDLTTLPKEEPKAEPKPEPKKETPAPPKEEPPAPKKETPKKGDPMKLPDKNDKSMDFLDGCWNCRTGLTDTRGNPIKVRFCFGKNGKGQISIIDRRGTAYTGRADAQMQNGRLHIDTGDATSRTSRGSFNGLRIDCTPGANNAAMCYGRNKGDNSPWKARFFRD